MSCQEALMVVVVNIHAPNNTPYVFYKKGNLLKVEGGGAINTARRESLSSQIDHLNPPNLSAVSDGQTGTVFSPFLDN